MEVTAQQVRDAARERFGHRALRPGQLEGVQSVVAGRDTLTVMSTGSGKSLIYQLAGQFLPGPTVVVSPLIALQRDQVEAADGDAEELNSTLDEHERDLVFAGLEDGETEFVLLAPEQLAREETRARLAAAKPSLLVVDEAHCVSEWGHDFRPDYLELGAAAEALGRPPILALTATAAPPVRDEVVERLGMRDPEIVVRGFDRPNIALEVRRFHDAGDKERALLDAVCEQPDGPGIVYVATQKGAERTAAALAERGVRAAAYHGGLSARRRETAQDGFMAGDLDVVVATIAFGMGVDKPDVRFVFHLDISASVDAYYQEIGRAGRDGEPARAVLFYRAEDLGRRRFFASGKVDRAALHAVAGALRSARDAVDPRSVAEELSLSRSKLATAVHRLEEAGVVEVQDDGAVALARSAEVEAGIEEAASAEEDREAFDRSRVEVMRAYAEYDGCRREFVLGYFGEGYRPPCDGCDNCLAGEVEPAADGPFAVGARVEHGEWGAGMVQRCDDEQVVVVFDSVGYKALATPLVTEKRLLRPV